MENFQSTNSPLAPRQAPDRTWVMASHASPETQFPLIDAVGDSGKFVGSILAEPDKYEGKMLCAATALYSLKDIADVMSKTTGKKIVYKQGSVEENVSFVGDLFAEYFNFLEEFGYFGRESKKLVAWAVENSRGRLSTFEEFMEAHPLQLA